MRQESDWVRVPGGKYRIVKERGNRAERRARGSKRFQMSSLPGRPDVPDGHRFHPTKGVRGG